MRSPFSRLGDSEKLRPDGSTQTPDFRRPRSSFEPSTRSLGSTCRATPTPRSSSENSIRSPRSCAASANPEDAATSANLDGVATSANPEVVETNYFLFDDNEFMKSTKKESQKFRKISKKKFIKTRKHLNEKFSNVCSI